MGSLLVCALLLSAGSVWGQAEAPSAAERIERLRDRAGQDESPVAEPAAQPAGGGEEAAIEASAEEVAEPIEAEKPLPPNENLPLGVSDGGLFGSDQAAQSGAKKPGDGWLLSTLAALGVVLALVFGIRWALRRGGVVSTAVPQGSVVEVLSRTTVAPRSHVVLMRVGHRVLIVSDSPTGMRTLDTISEPEEVAELLGAVDSSRESSMSKNFSGVMKKLSGQWSAEDQSYESEPGMAGDEEGVGMDRTRGALSSVRGRLAALASAGGKA